jgi:hypothetical protein
MDRYTFPTGTTGGEICCRDIRDRTMWMRKFRGAQVYPVITLSDCFMKNRYGGRQRPHLIVKRWIGLGDDGKAPPAPTEPRPRLTDGGQENQEKKPAIQSPPQSNEAPHVTTGVRVVEPPSLSEEMGDEIPSSGSAGKSDQNPGSRVPTAGAATAKKVAKKPSPERARSRT